MWDTPDFWARSEADEVLREMPNVEPAALADSFEKTAASYDGDPQMVALIVADLRRRAADGIRFWPGPRPTDDAPAPARPGEADTAVDIAQLIDDEIPW